MALDDAGRRADVLRRMGFGAVVALTPDEARATVGCDRAWDRDMEARWREGEARRSAGSLPTREAPAAEPTATPTLPGVDAVGGAR